MNKVQFTLAGLTTEKEIELEVPLDHKIKVVGSGFVEAYMIGVSEYVMWEGIKYRVVKHFIKDWSYR